MTRYPFCDPYVWESPKVMLSTGFVVKKHKDGACASEYVNHVIFVYVLCLLAGSVVTIFMKSHYALSFFIGLATLYCLPTFWILTTLQAVHERFTDSGSDGSKDEKLQWGPQRANQWLPPAWRAEKAGSATKGSSNHQEVYEVIGMGAAPNMPTLPSARNPFMNVLIDEIKYNPTRPTAVSIMDPSVRVTIDEFFRTDFYSDPTDVFGKTQGQRQFVTMPSTGIPNDRESYQNWLYKIPGMTCKEGGREACLPGTDGGAIPWLNVNP